MATLPTNIHFEGTDPITGGMVRVLELQDSRAIGDTASIVLTVTGTAAENIVRWAVEEAIAATVDDAGQNLLSFDGKPLSGINPRPMWVDTGYADRAEDPDAGVAEDAGRGYQAGRWNVTLTYSRQAFTAVPTADPTLLGQQKAMEIDITAETVRIKQAIATTAYPAAGETARDYGGMIGVTANRAGPQVAGGDMAVGRELLKFPKTYPSGDITDAWHKDLRALIGKTNSQPVSMTLNGQQHFFDIDELQFWGASGKVIQGSAWADFTLSFRAGRTNFAPTATLGKPGATAAVPLAALHPFQTVDIDYGEWPNAANDNKAEPYPRQALVHTMALQGDFGFLQLV